MGDTWEDPCFRRDDRLSGLVEVAAVVTGVTGFDAAIEVGTVAALASETVGPGALEPGFNRVCESGDAD